MCACCVCGICVSTSTFSWLNPLGVELLADLGEEILMGFDSFNNPENALFVFFTFLFLQSQLLPYQRVEELTEKFYDYFHFLSKTE